MAKHTLMVTQQCNLRCKYCYVEKSTAVMSLAMAKRAIDFSFRHTPPDEVVDIGYFGGEPLIEFLRLREITAAIKDHPDYRRERVVLSLISNGTVWSNAIADYLEDEQIHLCISCDGPADVQDSARRFRNGRPTSAIVERHLQRAAARFPSLHVNAVVSPATLRSLPRTIDYLVDLGVRKIHLNPDYSASWSLADIDALPGVYGEVGGRYLHHRLRGVPVFVNLIDSKIAAILRGGYQATEKCRMGSAEFAYAPGGWIYPCERLIGAGDGSGPHCMGHFDSELKHPAHACSRQRTGNPECLSCGIRDYCMRWCACSNFFSSGRYDGVGPFLCASERAAIAAAFDVFRRVEQKGEPAFFEHASGRPHLDAPARASPVAPPAPIPGQAVRFFHPQEGGFSHD